MSLAATPGEAHLPFRRSCDRCHGQKVRCIRTQESSHPDSEPCVRCKRSGSICIFSPQQKPGRPPLGSDARETTSSAMYSRKRRRQSPSSVDLPQSPPPTCPVTSLPDSASVVGSLSLDPTLFSPFTTGDELGDGSFSDPDFLMSIPTMPSIDSLSSSPRQKRSVSEGNAVHSVVDNIERDTEELGNLTLQVYRAARALSSSYPTSLAVSSPSLNEIFASTEALISIIRRNTSGSSNDNKYDPFSTADPAGFSPQADWEEFNWLQSPPHHEWVLPQMSSTVNKAPDTSIVMMILACHQRLLTTLGGILFYISRHLRQQQQPQNLPIGASHFIELPTTQALIIVNLVSHQLQRLDRAVGLLAEDGATKGQLGSAARTIATRTLSPLSPEQSKSPQSVSDTEDQSSQSKLKTATNSDSDELGIATSIDSSSSGSHKAITLAIDMMTHRQEQLQKQIKTVKQQISNFDSI
ncbi:hypothetical protein TrVFT333_007500 [Trichoderma virens FT-333]|nr:hypothetical protein TrVFT333_007500 [Trichoderma virens FT-333]